MPHPVAAPRFPGNRPCEGWYARRRPPPWRTATHAAEPMRLAFTAIAALGLAACATAPASPVAPAPEATYEMIVANESADVMSRVTFEPGVGLEVVEQIPVGVMPTELDSPHGVVVSRDQRYWFVTLGHGTPFGWLWKFDASADTALGRVELGPFPASLDLTPDGRFAFVVNFNLHGDPVPSSVSVVDTETMEEVARPTTCVMPHGSRVDAAGDFHYSVCMHSDQLVLIDARTFEVSRRVSLAPGREGILDIGDTGAHMHGAHAGHEERHADHEHHYETAGEMCSPTWATPGRGNRDGLVYVPCNRTDVVLEVDPQEGVVRRTFATGQGPYNTEVTPDGRLLLVTLKGAQGVAVIDLDRGEELARISTSQPITHGVVVPSDGRYAFVTSEGIGSTPGTLDVIDLEALERVGSVPLSLQPGGIDMLRPTR
jgi:DNA-binding beta-propeller fold protein YncE